MRLLWPDEHALFCRMRILFRPALVSIALAVQASAALTDLVNGDFEAQRAEYDASSGYLSYVTSWYDNGNTGGGYNPFILSRIAPREGDSASHWPAADNTMIVGFAANPPVCDGYIYQQIGTYEPGMKSIKVDFDAIRRQNSRWSTGFRPFEVQLWTGGSGTPADDTALSTLGAAKRASVRFTAADIGSFVNNTPALQHMQVSLDPVDATTGDKLWLQIVGTGGNDFNNTYLDNIVVSGGEVPAPPTGATIMVR